MNHTVCSPSPQQVDHHQSWRGWVGLERAEPEEESRGWALGNTDCPSSLLGGALKKMVYLAMLGLSYDTWDLCSLLWLAGSSSLTRNQTWATLCIENSESWPLDPLEVPGRKLTVHLTQFLMDASKRRSRDFLLFFSC